MELNVHQLMALRHLEKNCVVVTLLTYVLTRSGCTEADWQACRAAGLVCERHHKLWLTTVGKKVYRTQKKTKWF